MSKPILVTCCNCDWTCTYHHREYAGIHCLKEHYRNAHYWA